jgi:hypothetical protein
MILKFTKEKETTGTVRYMEDGDKKKWSVGYLYVKNAAVAKLGNPDKLTVTIEKAK